MQHVTAALAAPHVLRHARRALLLLGAAFAWWLLFSGGSAHAAGASSGDSVPTPGANAQPGSLGRTIQDVLTRTTGTATTTLGTAPRQLTGTVTRATSTAPEPVRSTVRTVTTGLEPTLTATTTAVADTLDHTVRTVQTAVQPTVDAVTPQATPTSAPTATPVAAAPAQQGVRASRHADPNASADRLQAPSHVVVDTATSRTVNRSAAPSDDAPGLPVAPSAPAMPGTGSAPAGPLAALGGLLLLPTSALRRRRPLDRALLGPDPVYPPGCSPD